MPHRKEAMIFDIELGIAMGEDPFNANVTEFSVGWDGMPFCSVSKHPSYGFGISNLNFSHKLLKEKETPYSDLKKVHHGLLSEMKEYFDEQWQRLFATEGEFDAALMQHLALDNTSGALPKDETEFTCLPPGLNVNYDDMIQENLEYHQMMWALLKYMMLMPLEIIREETRLCHHLGPIRQRPGADFVPIDSGGHPQIHTRCSMGLAAWDVIVNNASDHPKTRRLNDWMSSKGKLDTGYEIVKRLIRHFDEETEFSKLVFADGEISREKLAEAMDKLPSTQEVLLRQVSDGVLVYPDEVGEGLTQLIPLVVLQQPSAATEEFQLLLLILLLISTSLKKES